MNIAINTRVLLKNRIEGVCRYILETTRRMVESNPDDTFYFIFDRPFDEDFIFGPNVIPLVVGPPTRHPILWYIWFEWRLPSILKKYNIDVFLSPDTYLSLSTNVPTVLISHDIAYYHFPEQIPFLVRKYYQRYFPRYHQAADHIMAVSKATKKDLIAAFNLEEKNITVAPNSSPEHFKPISPMQKQQVRDEYSNGRKFFIYVGSIHPRKNVANAIKAFDKFKESDKSDISFLIIGRKAWNTDAFDKALNATKYRKDIFFSNEFVEDVSHLVAASEAMVYISLFEGFGIPILEAMHCDVPVITSNCSSMPEVAGDAAILVSPTDIGEIASAMEDVLIPSKKAELIKKSRENIKRYSWVKTSKTIYDQLLKSAKKLK